MHIIKKHQLSYYGNGKWAETGLSRYLNKEFLNAFSDGGFRSYLANVRLDTAKCALTYLNFSKTTSDNKTKPVVPNNLDVMGAGVKIFIPSRRNVCCSPTMTDNNRIYYTAEVGFEDTDCAKESNGQLKYTSKKGVSFTCNGDPLFPIFNVSVSGSTVYNSGNSKNGLGFMNKNWFLLSNKKPINNKAFLLRGSNHNAGRHGLYFVDYDGNVRCSATDKAFCDASQACVCGKSHGITLRNYIINGTKKKYSIYDICEFNISFSYSAVRDGWKKSKTDAENKKITGPAAGLEYAAYWYNMNNLKIYHNRVWVEENFGNKGMVLSLDQLKNLYKKFGQIYYDTGATISVNMQADPYRNSMSAYYFSQRANDLIAKWKAYQSAKSQNKNYSSVKDVWTDIHWLIASTNGKAPFNTNDKHGMNNANKYPIGRRIGILPVCVFAYGYIPTTGTQIKEIKSKNSIVIDMGVDHDAKLQFVQNSNLLKGIEVASTVGQHSSLRSSYPHLYFGKAGCLIGSDEYNLKEWDWGTKNSPKTYTLPFKATKITGIELISNGRGLKKESNNYYKNGSCYLKLSGNEIIISDHAGNASEYKFKVIFDTIIETQDPVKINEISNQVGY